jgi:hypothetical protein
MSINGADPVFALSIKVKGMCGRVCHDVVMAPHVTLLCFLLALDAVEYDGYEYFKHDERN